MLHAQLLLNGKCDLINTLDYVGKVDHAAGCEDVSESSNVTSEIILTSIFLSHVLYQRLDTLTGMSLHAVNLICRLGTAVTTGKSAPSNHPDHLSTQPG